MTELREIQTAHQNLQYIRQTLEAAERFTAVPGKGLMAAGILALGGVACNYFFTGAPWEADASRPHALDTWGWVLGLALAVVSYEIYRKAQLMRTPLRAPLVRKLLWSLCPALFVGGLLTRVAVHHNSLGWLPVIWLGCYGAAVTNGGQHSVAPVRYMGLSFLLAAAGAAASPEFLGLTWLALGFGMLHLFFGAFIAWRHHG
jgi:hypothetical protein